MVSEQNLSKQSIRTKTHLKKAFISLINEKGYSHVTITDIVNMAQYNRTTFYLYYVDKIELTAELQDEMFESIKSGVMDRYTKGEIINIEKMGSHSYGLMYFIYENQAFFNLFLKKDTIPGLYQDLPRAIYEVFEENFILTAKESQSINYAEYKLYMAHGTAGLIIDWIRNGYNITPDDMSIRLIKILQTFAKRFTIVNT